MRKKLTAMLLLMALLIQSSTILTADTSTERFTDVEVGHWADQNIHELRHLGVTDGIGDNKFGFGDTLQRSHFVAFLTKLNQWEFASTEEASFLDVKKGSWYYDYIETAVAMGVVSADEENFLPADLITREEMGIMIVKSLGYGWLAEEMKDRESPFEDVTDHIGYITILKDFGIVNGTGNGLFEPKASATREQAAAILMRMYNKTNGVIDESNAFYRDKSYGQMDLMNQFDVVSFGWADLEMAEDQVVTLSTSFPTGYTEPLLKADAENDEVRLSIFGEDNDDKLSMLLASEDNTSSLIEAIMGVLSTHKEFDGLVIDFEGLKGAENKENFVSFLTTLDETLSSENKTLTVMVQPSLNYDGYNFEAINDIADQMIMMAHDFSGDTLDAAAMDGGFTISPLSELENVYDALAAMTVNKTNVDVSKMSLQISFASLQWQVNLEGDVINQKAYKPTYDQIYNRLVKDDTELFMGTLSRNPYAKYYDSEKELYNTIWYEDSRSVDEKIKLAKMFGIYDISVWRLGNIPNYTENGTKDVYMDLMPLFSK